MTLARWFAPLIALALMFGGAQAQTLVIVGGGLSAENAAVYRAFIDALPNPRTDRIAIIAASSVEPAQSAESARAAFARHGVAAERIVVLPLAVVDDPATPDLDESAWVSNGDSVEVAAEIGRVGGVWFTGGDQVRAMRVLRPGPVLDALHAVLARRGVLGGTSAGAALMGDPMIGRGDAVAALTLAPLSQDADEGALESGALFVTRGAGFFRHGLVDQHFDRDVRLGRLVRAMAMTGVRRGYGIDEDTALIVDLRRGRMRVVGAGAVMALDARGMATVNLTPFIAGPLRVTLLWGGDSIGLNGRDVVASRRSAAPTGDGLSARLWRAFEADDQTDMNMVEADEVGRATYAFTLSQRRSRALGLRVAITAMAAQ